VDGDAVKTSLTPTAAKVATAKGAAISGVLAQLTEVVVAACAAWLRSTDHLTEQNFLLIVAAVIIGPGVAKIRGVVPTATLALVWGALPLLAKKTLL